MLPLLNAQIEQLYQIEVTLIVFLLNKPIETQQHYLVTFPIYETRKTIRRIIQVLHINIILHVDKIYD